MMKNRKKAIVMLLLATIQCVSVTACQSAETDVKETTTPAETETAVTEDPYLDNLPDTLDFGGETLNILIRSDEHFLTEMLVEEAQGDIVDDAVYQRNLMVTERLNCEFSYNIRDAIWLDGSAHGTNDYIYKSVIADDREFDLICGYGSLMAYLVLEDCFYDFLDVPHLDLNQPWWPTDYVNQMTINGEMHLLTGDALLSSVSHMYAVFFNKRIARDFACDDFYASVLDGTWTLDKMIETVSDIYSDVNGDGVADTGDIYGMCNQTLDPFATGSAESICIFDKNGYPVLNIMNEKITNVYDKLYDLTWNNAGTYPLTNHGEDNGEYLPQFAKDQLLFAVGPLQNVYTYRSMDTDYGILPIPKYDEAQKSYYTIGADHATLFAIPNNCDKVELIGATLEALSAESYRSVIPTYYEVALKVKYNRDDETCQMLDILHDGRQYNMGFMFCLPLGIEGSILRLIYHENENLASAYEKNQKQYEKNLQALIDYYWNE